MMGGLAFEGGSLAQSKPLQAALRFSQAEEDAVSVLSGGSEEQRGGRQLGVALILYTHGHLHLSLKEKGRESGWEEAGRDHLGAGSPGGGAFTLVNMW